MNLPGDMETGLKHLRWRVYLAYWNTLLTLRQTHGPAVPDPDEICWVPPDRIHLSTSTDGSPCGGAGQACAGESDLSSTRFASRELYQAIRDRIENGTSWPDSPFYARRLAWMAAGRTIEGCTSKDDLDRLCAETDEAISLIRRRNGSLGRGLALGGEGQDPRQSPPAILCKIDRHGRFLLHSGLHPLAIYKVLNIDRVPVRILARHRKWQEVRNTLTLLAEKQNWRLYQPAAHPDLEDLPALHGCTDRFEVIRSHLRKCRGAMLDLGANLCYFCHKFEDLGFECIGVEADPLVGRLAETIRVASGKNFQVMVDDLLKAADHPIFAGRNFDVVLALNIFHHFLKTKNAYVRLQEWLQKMSTHMSVLFFEPHNPNESQMRHAYRNYGEEAFVGFVMKNAGFTRATCICHSSDDRRLYKLDRGS